MTSPEEIKKLSKTMTRDELAHKLNLTRGQVNYLLTGRKLKEKKDKGDMFTLCPITGFKLHW